MIKTDKKTPKNII